MYAFYGGALTLSYQLIMDYFEHHETNKDRPRFFNHWFATTLISTGLGMFYKNPVTGAGTGFVFGLFLVGPMTWWLYKQGRLNSSQSPANIFYENGVTAEEVERIRHLDAIEQLAFQMQSTPGYGYISRDQMNV